MLIFTISQCDIGGIWFDCDKSIYSFSREEEGSKTPDYLFQ